MGLFGVWVLGTSFWHAAYGTLPEAVTMGAVGFGSLFGKRRLVRASLGVSHR